MNNNAANYDGEEEDGEEGLPYDQRVLYALDYLDIVYGPVGTDGWPWSLETYEAGPCANGHRRYLFTDAWAVCAYQTLVEYYMNNNDLQSAALYQGAVERLIAVVHDSLGKPRSNKNSDKMKECDISPTGYVGLRIGKVRCKGLPYNIFFLRCTLPT